MKKLFFLPLIFLLGCSTKPKHLSQNEINDPIFYPKNHASIGASYGLFWADKPISYDFYGTPKDEKYKTSQIINPIFSYNVNISKWAGFQIWPFYWQLLLTGEQFEDSLHLKIKKMNISLEGGLSGIAYSQRDEWTTSLSFSGGYKYLFSSKYFNTTNFGYSAYNTIHPTNFNLFINSNLGVQVSEKNSLSLIYHWTYFNIPNFSTAKINGILFSRDDSATELGLSHSYFLFNKHIFGPNISFGMKNLKLSNDNYFIAGLNYTYIFN